jgi:hypothetical protein
MSPHLNSTWCKDVNSKLLNQAGYSCHAHHWITYGGKGERQEHMCIAVSTWQKGDVQMADQGSMM